MKHTNAPRALGLFLIIFVGLVWGGPSLAAEDSSAVLLDIMSDNATVIDTAHAVLLTLVLNRDRIGCELVLDHFTILNLADETRAHLEHALDLLTVSKLSDKEEVRFFCERRLEFLARWYTGQSTETRKRLQEISFTNEHPSYREIGTRLVSVMERYEKVLRQYIPASGPAPD